METLAATSNHLPLTLRLPAKISLNSDSKLSRLGSTSRALIGCNSRVLAIKCSATSLGKILIWKKDDWRTNSVYVWQLCRSGIAYFPTPLFRRILMCVIWTVVLLLFQSTVQKHLLKLQRRGIWSRYTDAYSLITFRQCLLTVVWSRKMIEMPQVFCSNPSNLACRFQML